MLTPDVSHTVGGVLPDLSAAEGELGLAFLGRGRVLRQELHDVRVFLVAPRAASADDVHDAREDVAGGAAESASRRRATRFLFLTRFQDLKGKREQPAQESDLGGRQRSERLLTVSP